MPIYHHKTKSSTTTESDTSSASKIIYYTSEGFDEFGHSIEYNSAEDANCNNVPKKGLVFYASLNGETTNKAETGQSLITSGNISYNIENSIPCAYFNGYSCIHSNIAQELLPTQEEPRTVSLWMKATKVYKSYMFAYGTEQINKNYFCLVICHSNNHLGIISWGFDPEISTYYDLTNWIHYLATYENGLLKLYVNGKNEENITANLNTGYSDVYLGSRINNSENFTGYISSVRIYDRVLTQKEINILSKEFKI